MQRWEYLHAGIFGRRWLDSHGRSAWLSVRQDREGELVDASAVLDELGEQGWELVGFGTDVGSIQHLILKRPKP